MKKVRVTIDINVILDLLENRNGWVVDAAKTCAVCGAQTRVVGFIPVHAVTTIYYIVRKRGGKALADKTMDWLLALFKVSTCGADEFRAARQFDMADFEDAVVAATARRESCDYIVTRNEAHFRNSPVKAISPAKFAAQFDDGKLFALWR